MSTAVRTLATVLTEIETEAARKNLDAGEFLGELLDAYQAGNTGGMELGQSHCQQLRELLGAGVSNPKELIDRVRRLNTIQIESTRIRLSPMVLERLNTRKRHYTMPEYLREIVPMLLEQYVGMR